MVHARRETGRSEGEGVEEEGVVWGGEWRGKGI